MKGCSLPKGLQCFFSFNQGFVIICVPASAATRLLAPNGQGHFSVLTCLPTVLTRVYVFFPSFLGWEVG